MDTEGFTVLVYKTAMIQWLLLASSHIDCIALWVQLQSVFISFLYASNG